jgi:hypothetical protein
MKQEEIKKIVRERYASVAREGGSCCVPKTSCCGSGKSIVSIRVQAKK